MRSPSRIVPVILVLAVVAAWLGHRPAALERGPGSAGLYGRTDTVRSIGASFSPALAASLPEGSLDLVSIVAADIDDDGDLDVVASDASLNLFVWLNDGSGHLTRLRPRRSNDWRAEPTDPAVDGGGHSCDMATQTSQPSPPLARHTEWVPMPAREHRPRAAGAALQTIATSTQGPRAPPASLVL